MEQFGFSHFITSLDVIGMSVLGALMVLSIASWYIITLKGIALYRLNQKTDRFLVRFFEADSIGAMADIAQEPNAQCRLSSLVQKVVTLSHCHSVETIDTMSTRILRHGIDSVAEEVEKGMTLLASAGSVSPFIGLFGTVWGIYHALLSIGMMTQSSLDAVAGPVGEALIMTAFGLAVAIPSVLAYNAFMRANRLYLSKIDGFAHDLHLMAIHHASTASAKEQ